MPFIIHWVDSCTGADDEVTVNTPAGKLVLFIRQGVISNADWSPDDSQLNESSERLPELSRYWLNPDTPVTINLLKQGSDYRHRVWAELCRIPFGVTMTYSALARKIGSSARAVGNACRDNPYPLFIPCHRVVAVSGMGGYCGQKEGDVMNIKRKLLEFEATYKK